MAIFSAPEDNRIWFSQAPTTAQKADSSNSDVILAFPGADTVVVPRHRRLSASFPWSHLSGTYLVVPHLARTRPASPVPLLAADSFRSRSHGALVKSSFISTSPSCFSWQVAARPVLSPVIMSPTFLFWIWKELFWAGRAGEQNEVS